MDENCWHMNATLGGANLHPGVNLHSGENLLPGPKSAYEHSFSQLVTNGLSNPYQMDVSIFIFRGIGSNFSILCHVSMKIVSPTE